LSFGGGGSGGSSTVAAHTHNSTLAGDGGSLSSSLSQIQDTPLYTRIIIGVTAVSIFLELAIVHKMVLLYAVIVTYPGLINSIYSMS